MSAGSSGGRTFVRRHWGAIAAFAVAAAAAFAWSIYVFLWFVGMAQSSGLVPGTLGLWTMANLIAFILNALFWELLLVGIPVAVSAVVGWLWWKRIPRVEKMGHFWGSRRARGSGGLSLLFFIAFCTKVYIDGKWNVPIAAFTLDYMVGSMVTILEWGLIILGIPAAIALAWWVSREMKKP